MTDIIVFLLGLPLCLVWLWLLTALRTTEMDMYMLAVAVLCALFFTLVPTGQAALQHLFGPMSLDTATAVGFWPPFALWFGKVLYFRFRTWDDRPRPRAWFEVERP